jgi:hypothetical protein
LKIRSFPSTSVAKSFLRLRIAVWGSLINNSRFGPMRQPVTERKLMQGVSSKVREPW